MEHYVVTVYIDAEDRNSVDMLFGAASNTGKLVDVNIKNWIVDDDETPELQQ